jgi:hypothetical protein
VCVSVVCSVDIKYTCVWGDTYMFTLSLCLSLTHTRTHIHIHTHIRTSGASSTAWLQSCRSVVRRVGRLPWCCHAENINIYIIHTHHSSHSYTNTHTCAHAYLSDARVPSMAQPEVVYVCMYVCMYHVYGYGYVFICVGNVLMLIQTRPNIH